MVKLSMMKKGYHPIAKASVQMVERANINSEHIIRGIFSGDISCSFAYDIDKTCKFYISTFGQGNARQAQDIALSKMHSLLSLMPGCKYVDSELQVQPSRFLAGIHLMGVPHIGFQNQMNEFINAITCAKIPTIILLNIHPIHTKRAKGSEPKKERMRESFLTSDSLEQYIKT